MISALILAAGLACGTERAGIKHLTDPEAQQVGLENRQEITIHELGELKPKATVKGDEPRGVLDAEFHVFEVVGEVFVAKIEADQDYHLAICEPGHWEIASGCQAGYSMVTESVDPRCAPKSRVFHEMVAVRLALRKIVGGPINHTSIRKLVGKMLRLRGVGFVDVPHGQSGMAPNAIELHPITSVEWVK